MKFFKIINLTLLFLFSSSLANAKPMPPGTGNAVPSNILFLVDRSQSMNTSSSGRVANKMRRPPVDVVGRGGGIYYLSTKAEGGFFTFNADTDSKANGSFHNKQGAYGYQNAGFGMSVNVEYHAGTNKLYVLGDQRIGTEDYRSHGPGWGIGGFVAYAVDPTKKASTKPVQLYNNNGRTYGLAAFTKRAKNHSVGNTFKFGNGFYWISPTKNKNNHIHDMYGDAAVGMMGLTSMSLHEDKLYIVTSGKGRSEIGDDIGGMIVVNINNQTYPNWKGIFHCAVGRTYANKDSKLIYGYFNEAIDVVTEGSKTVMYGKKGTSIYRVELSNDGCIPDYNNYTPIVQNDPCGKGKGSSIVVKNKKIYTTGYHSHTVCRHDVLTTTSTASGGTANFVKKVGIRDATRLNSTSLGDIYLLNPMGIDFGRGSANHEKTLFVVSEGRSEVTMIDENDLSYKDHFGDPGISRFTGVKEAIRYILNDSATTQQADFGIALWYGTKNNFNGFKMDGNGDPIFTEYKNGEACRKDACLEVGINPRGAQQILSLFDNEAITLHYQTKTKGFRQLLHNYFYAQTYPSNPIDPTKLNCQTTAIILIGDGNFKDLSGGKISNDTVTLIGNMFNDPQKKILTYAVGYGEGIDPGGREDFTKIARAGGTLALNNGKAFFPQTPADLKKVTDTIVQDILAKKVIFSSPSISSEVKKSGELYQARFENRNNKEWFGTVVKTTLEVDDGDARTETWSASSKMPSPDNRNLWTSLPGDTSINNFTKTNVAKIRDLFELQDNQIGEYYRATTGGQFTANTTICGVGRDGTNNDEDIGLIEFVRGKDYFDYNGNCDINEERKGINKDTGLLEKRYLADIYNSNLLILGSPKGSYSDYNNLSEAYFRLKKNYSIFASNNASRPEVIFGAANNGILHAFSSADRGNIKAGEEIWGFVPPLIIPKMPTINNASLNGGTAGGGTIPRFLLDGSPIAHDTYFDHPAQGKPLGWYTLLMIPYGRAGAGFSVIDVTDIDNPNHLYSILNDAASQKIFRVDHEGTSYEYPYRTNIITGNQFDEVLKAEENADLSKPNTCNATGTTSCYMGDTLTLTGQVLDKSLLEITINGEYVTSASTLTDDGSNTIIKLPKSITHNAGDENGVVDNVSIVEIGQIDPNGVDYDYRFLGETWGSPRVFRMPNSGPGDTDVMDDEYVAVLPGGFGNGMPSIGSNVYIIDWLTGKVKKEIKINDSSDNDIVNSIPASPVVITSDAAQEAFSGALVYINDLEGKITKINLTNLQGSYSYNQTSGAVTQIPPTGTANSGTLPQNIKLYDNYTFFDLQASTKTNNRYMYHSMEAGKGAKSKKFWLFGGTGDYMNLNDKQVQGSRVKNVMFGIKDHMFPGFGSVNSTPDKLTECKNMTDETSAACADTGDRGWYKILSDQKKVVAEPTLANNIVYYPIYKPNTSSLGCGEGDALICAVDADCGYNRSSELDDSGATAKTDCYKVGVGVLSKLVIFGKKLYANISGKTDEKKAKTDIVIINALDSDNLNLRSSWRENF